MGLTEVLAAVGLAALGYGLKVSQDWLSWRRKELEEHRHRWKAPRRELIVQLMDEAQRLEHLAADRRVTPQELPAVLREFERLNNQSVLLMAHRDTNNHLQMLRNALLEALATSAQPGPATELGAKLTAVRGALAAVIHMARSNELGLAPIGILMGPESRTLKAQFWSSYHRRRWERRRG